MNKNKLLSKTTKDQLIADFKELKSVPKIAKKYNINTQTVYSAFKIINYDCFVRQDVSLILTKEYLSEAYIRLKSFKAIAREINADPTSVKFYMDKYSIEYKKFEKYKCNEQYFKYDTAESFYIAGFIAADGCIKEKSSILSIELSEVDENLLNLIKNKFNAENPLNKKIVKNSKRNSSWKDSNELCLKISSKEMCKDLERFNIVPRKTHIYKMPEWLINHELVHHFLRGYNDGDGSFYTGKYDQIYFSLRGNTIFLKQVRDIFENNNLTIKRDTEIRLSSCHGILEYGGNGVLAKICNFLYKDSTICLDRKFDKIKYLFN